MSKSKDRALKLIYGESLLNQIKSTRVLVAGAGGVGSELIKNLALTGFENLTVIDFDFIDVSNLNRQIYAKQEHALQKQSKVEVICKNVLERYPHLRIQPLHANIMHFRPEFFADFDIVICALDSPEARKYLGKMCVMTNRIMIDAGTKGFSGQVKSQIRGVSACNQCRIPKFSEEVLSCSVRAVPIIPLHAILWAKDLFQRLFNTFENEKIAEFIENKSLLNQNFDQKISELAHMILDKYFKDDVDAYNTQIEWGIKVFPISFKEASEKKESLSSNQEKVYLHNQKILSLSEYVQIFVDSFIKCIKRKIQIGEKELVISKDDSDIINFILSATNLRIYNFLDKSNPLNQLRYVSLFEIKEKVGAIVPTIASTNSIVAAIQITESIKSISGDLKALQSVYVSIISPDKLTPVPNALPEYECLVCSYSNIYLNLNVGPKTTLKTFKDFFESYYIVRGIQIFICNLIYDVNEEDEMMIEIYNKKLELTLVQLLEKAQLLVKIKNGFKGSIRVLNSHEPFIFYCEIHIESDLLEDKIIPNKDSVREKVVDQQKMCLLKIYEEKKKKMNKLYEKHYYSLYPDFETNEFIQSNKAHREDSDI